MSHEVTEIEGGPAVGPPSPAPTPDVPLSSWTWGIGHVAIGLFLGAAFLDRLAAPTLTVGGLGPSLLGVAIGGLLAFGLLYWPMALAGFRTRTPLAVVARSTFGERGSRWIPGVLLGIAQVVWMAVALALAADYGVRGLLELGLLDAASVADREVAGLTIKAPVILFETIAWGLFAATMATFAIRVVSAVMYTYPIFPAIALGVAFVATLPGLVTPRFEPATMPMPGIDDGLMAALVMVQLIGGFYVTAGLIATDWGAACRERHDVTMGGLVGVALASTVFAAIALTLVANTLGPVPAEVVDAPAAPEIRPGTAEERLAQLLGVETAGKAETTSLPAQAADLSLGSALQFGVGGRLGGAILLVFALGLLGPCVFAPYLYLRAFQPVLPGVPRLAIALAGVLLAWPLVATGLALELPTIFALMGAVFGPIAGAIAADGLRGNRRASRPGWNLAGLIAWLVGLPIGLLPTLGAFGGWPLLESLQPATYLAFAAGFVVFLALSALGIGSPRSSPVRDA